MASKETSKRYSFLTPGDGPGELGWLGPYRVLRTLGVGGMAYVFHAEDTRQNRQVALKVMKPGLDETGHPELRFHQEARIMASLQHENLVSVYHVGEENGVMYLAMELLHGETLDRWLQRVGKASGEDVVRIGRQMAEGLTAIHQHGLLHRDLKPTNLWLEAPGGRIKILDFGLARYLEADIRLTQSDRTVGTPGFLSPEQARGDVVDLRSDLFSLGAVLYCLCTGDAPFHGSNTLAVLSALALDQPTPPHEINSRIPRGLSEYVLKLLAKEPAERPSCAEEVAAVFRHFEQGAFEAGLPQPRPPQPAAWRRQWRRLRAYLVWFVMAAILGIVGGVIVGWL
jgi:serine/threonine protein kinase